MADENKNKTPEEKNEIREKEKSKVDQGIPWYERAFLYAKSNPEAVADGIVGITSGVARVIKNGNLQYDLDKNKCPPKGEETKKEEKQDFEDFKRQAGNVYTDLRSFKGAGKQLKDITLETNLNFKLKEFPECIEQEFAGFFNYIPISYYISKLLSDATSTLTTAGIEELREDEGECKEANNEILDNIFKIIIDGLKRDGKVKFTNFGTFKILNKSPRIGRNPTTKKEYQINSRRVISFVSAKYIKNKINN